MNRKHEKQPISRADESWLRAGPRALAKPCGAPHSRGWKVIATARSLPPGGTPARFVQADVSTREGIDQIVKATMDRLGGLDILIHNVGGSAAPGGGALALSDDDWQRAFDTNLFAAVRLDRGFLHRC